MRHLLLILALFSGISATLPAYSRNWTQESSKPNTYHTGLPARTLRQVLNDWEKQYQVSYLYRADLGKTKVVEPSKVALPHEEALQRLLKGSNLGYQRTSERSYVILEKNEAQKNTEQEHSSTLESKTSEQFLAFEALNKYSLADLRKGNERRIPLGLDRPSWFKAITGKIVDANSGEPLIGASVSVKGTTRGAVTGLDGTFSLDAAETDVLEISYTGYSTLEVLVGDQSNIEIKLSEMASMLQELAVVGSRSQAARSRTETVAPVDVINAAELRSTGQVEPTQMIHFTVPSFNSSRQTVADGTDHIDPATLRGLGPDQVLVLLNGKRRHNTALININGTVGRGAVGTDLNSIPSSMIERLEVLRDGAASQYGSDAIAGVINVVMREKVGTTFTAHYGQHATSYLPLANAAERNMNDGRNLQLGLYHGFKLKGKGRLSIAFDARLRDTTNRVGDFTGTVYPYAVRNSTTNQFDWFDGFNGSALGISTAANAANTEVVNADNRLIAQRGFSRANNMHVGNSRSNNYQGAINGAFPLGSKAELYFTGSMGFRQGKGAGFYRYPKQTTQVIRELYPNGFLPQIHSDIQDASLLAGVKGTTGSGWNWDISSVFGQNAFRFDVENSNNASQFESRANAPTEFYAGTISFGQLTNNAQIAKDFGEKMGLESFNVAVGAEFRVDMYSIEQGEEASWRNFTPTSGRVGGAQVFPGFQPSNDVETNRNVLGAFVDIETDLTKRLLVNAAARFENYSDFGGNLAGKLAARYKFANAFVLRGAISNGFRAPSLHQFNFSNTSTQFVVANGQTVPRNVGTYRNNSQLARDFGIPELTAERSVNYSLGVTSKFGKIATLTIDAYRIDITDRIVITGNMNRTNTVVNQILTAAGQTEVNAAAFFTNAISTNTRGIDAVFTLAPRFRNGSGLDLTLAANFTENEIDGPIKTTPKLPADQFGRTFFSRLEESRIVVGQPRSKFAASATYRTGKLIGTLRAIRFGEVATWDETNTALDEVFSPKIVTDASLGYKVHKFVTATLGVNNLFDTYPDPIKNAGNRSDNRFVYSRGVTQFGFGGRYWFLAATANF
jgi:iron complex outermembrane recepter protein